MATSSQPITLVAPSLTHAPLVLPPLFYTLKTVTAIWSHLRNLFFFSQRPYHYSAGTLLYIVYDSSFLRTVAYITYVTRRTLDWLREWDALQESFGRFKAALYGNFSTNESLQERLRDIYTAALLLIEQTTLFLIASLNLVDIFSISGEEAVRQFFWHTEDLIESYSPNPSAWVTELKSNIPLLCAVTPHLYVPIGDPALLIGRLDNLFTTTKRIGGITFSDSFARSLRLALFPTLFAGSNLHDANGLFRNN